MCEKAFDQSKKALVDSPALAHYDPAKSVRLACDASPYGVGAVISHLESDGQERPIAFASRSLSGYAKIERDTCPNFWGTNVPPLPLW